MNWWVMYAFGFVGTFVMTVPFVRDVVDKKRPEFDRSRARRLAEVAEKNSNVKEEDLVRAATLFDPFIVPTVTAIVSLAWPFLAPLMLCWHAMGRPRL